MMEIKFNKRQQAAIDKAISDNVVDHLTDIYDWPPAFWNAVDKEIMQILLPIVKREMLKLSTDSEFIDSIVHERISESLR